MVTQDHLQVWVGAPEEAVVDSSGRRVVLCDPGVVSPQGHVQEELLFGSLILQAFVNGCALHRSAQAALNIFVALAGRAIQRQLLWGC